MENALLFGKKTGNPPAGPYSMKEAIEFLGAIGGFSHSPSDGPYGLKSIWKGLSVLRLAVNCRQFMGQV
jgi:hypothetical protein